jgi:acyl-CoA dehydrogenase
MDFAFSAEQQQIREAILKLCARFDDDYWTAKERAGEFPHELHAALAEAGWLGIAMPAAYGGSGLGIAEAAIMMQAIAESGAAMSGASAVHMNIFGLQPVVVLGTEEQKQRMLPPMIAGKDKACFAVTEPDAGLDTTNLKVRAERNGDDYVLSGQKIWISSARVANKVLILARTTPVTEVKRKTEGLTLFYTDIDRSHVVIRAIDKMGRHAVDSNEMFFDAMPVPAADRIGADGDGFRAILHGMNPERILIAAEAVGIGRAALRKASSYARSRVVFGRPIGQNQGIAHPLAQCWMSLEAANLMAMKAATLYDRNMECAVEANAAKYLAGEAAFHACETAVMTHGGMGYSKEFQVERYLREVMIPRIAPVTPHMILNFIAERALGLPKSY